MRFSGRKAIIEPLAVHWHNGELPLVRALHELFSDQQAMKAFAGESPWSVMSRRPERLDVRGYTYARYVVVQQCIERFGYNLMLEIGVPAAQMLTRVSTTTHPGATDVIIEAIRSWMSGHEGARPGSSTAYRIARVVAPGAMPFPSQTRIADDLHRDVLRLRALLRRWSTWSKNPRRRSQQRVQLQNETDTELGG